jgi:hypothetical protein
MTSTGFENNGTNLNISNLKFDQTEVGKLIKGSKAIYTWEMILDGNKRKVELIHSKLTGKRRIFLDGKVVAKVQRYTYEFQYSFLIEKHYAIIIQTSPDSYELRLDNISFSSLINKEKINKFNTLRKENPKTVSISDIDLEKNSNNVASKVSKIDDDFFSNYGNKFSNEVYFHEKNFFNNDDWNFEKKEKDIIVNKKADIFENVENKFEFKNQNEAKVPASSINTNNLLILKKPSLTNKQVTENKTDKPQQNLLEINDIFSAGNTTDTQTMTGSNINNFSANNKSSLLDFNPQFTSSTQNNVRSADFNNQNQVIKIKKRFYTILYLKIKISIIKVYVY